jgi:hypothetical protein
MGIAAPGFHTVKGFPRRPRRKVFPPCSQQWKGFGNIVHYLDKKRELEALDGKLERGEGFMVEFKD